MKKLQGVGLALSGGGFRASLFHLGSTKRLHELGLLQRVTRLSTVSGGSILAGFLADVLISSNRTRLEFDDWEREVSMPFRRFVRRDIRTGLVLRHIGWNWFNSNPRAEGYERALSRGLTARKLAELPDKEAGGVEFMFLATDMKHGVLWKFTRDTVGDYVSGSWDTPAEMSIAKAVAASASFPPIFGPMIVERPNGEKAYLTDGGVYDNSAMEPIWDETEIVLVSDAGAPFSKTLRNWYGARLLRYSEIGRNQVGAQRRRALIRRLAENYRSVRIYERDDADLVEIPSPCQHKSAQNCFMERRRQTDKPIGAYWRISSQSRSFHRQASEGFEAEVQRQRTRGWYGYSDTGEDNLVETAISRIRTDLDSFTTAESAILENHGYFMADIALRRHMRSDADFSQSFNVPNPNLVDEDAVRIALKRSSSRWSFWRRWFDKS